MSCFHETRDDWSSRQMAGCKLEAILSWLRAHDPFVAFGKQFIGASNSSGHFYILAVCRLVPPGRALHAVHSRLHSLGRGLDVAGRYFCALRSSFHVLGGHLDDLREPFSRGGEEGSHTVALGTLHLPRRGQHLPGECLRAVGRRLHANR